MALDRLNFLLADVQGGVGPFLAIYLWSSQGWDATHVGVIMTIAGIATGVARRGHGLDTRRQSHSGRIGRQSNRRATRLRRKRGHRLLNLFQSRRAAHAADASLRRLVAKQQCKAADSEVIGKVADRYDARHRAV